MKEKILVLRTAKMQVVDMLLQELPKDSDITFLAQSNIVYELENKYPFAKVCSINGTYFSYKEFCENIAIREKFDSVYVLASGMSFDGYEEVFQIVESIRHKRLILYNGKGEKSIERDTFYRRLKDELYSFFSRLYMKWIGIWYKYRGKKIKF